MKKITEICSIIAMFCFFIGCLGVIIDDIFVILSLFQMLNIDLLEIRSVLWSIIGINLLGAVAFYFLSRFFEKRS